MPHLSTSMGGAHSCNSLTSESGLLACDHGMHAVYVHALSYYM